MVQIAEWPSFLKSLPEAQLPISGIRGWIFQSDRGQAVFLESIPGCKIPDHSHGDQWGIVVAGSIELTIGGKTESLSAGDSYFIPNGVIHSAVIAPGFRALDFFADRNRYRPIAG